MKRKGRSLKTCLVILITVALLAAIAPSGILGAQGADQSQKIRVLIGFSEMPGASEEALVRAFGGDVIHTYSLIPAINAKLPEAAIGALAGNPRITVIEPDMQIYATGTYEEELNNTWGMVRIGEGSAHASGYLGAAVKIAILDSGIDSGHPELSGIYAGGYDFVNEDGTPNDIDGHGTHVAGTIAAAMDGAGVVGAAPAAMVYSLKVLEGGSGYFGDVIEALGWCVEHGINVTNNSYGSSGDPGVLVKNAFDEAYTAGILSIASAGNEGNPAGRGDTVGYPAAYDSVVAVAASADNDKRASFSSTGPDVELIAPGVNIYSTWLTSDPLYDGYRYASGTSMASPHVAGVAAQVWALDLSLSNTDIRNILRDTAEDLGLPATYQGYGLVRADLAAAAVVPVARGSLSGIVTDTGGSAIPGASVEIAGLGLSGITGESGSYLINDIPVGNYQVTASAEGYYNVTSTADIAEGSEATLDFTMTEKAVYTLTVLKVGLGETTPATGTYYDGTSVDLSAAPASGYIFEKWVIGDEVVSEAETTVVVDSDITATAYFIPAPVSDAVVDVTTDLEVYSGNIWVYITAVMTDQSGPISGAAMQITVEDPFDNMTYLSGMTDQSGKVVFKYRVLKTSAKGTYDVTAKALWDGQEVTGTTSFIVK